jgi:hypothetical protein
MRMSSKVSKVSMAAAVSAALLAGACAPRAKPVGYVGGALLSVAGTLMAADAANTDCTPEDPFTGVFTVPACATGSAFGVMFGTMTLLTGVGILIAAAASPSGAESASAPPAALSGAPGAPGGYPAGPLPPLQPSRSPSAPSGSPLSFH